MVIPRPAISVWRGLLRLVGRLPSTLVRAGASPLRVQVDLVWSDLSDAGEEYLCLRLADGSRSAQFRTIGSPLLGSERQLLAAAEIAVTLEMSPDEPGAIMSFRG